MKNRLKQVPLKPGVYMFKSAGNEIIYVGKAKLLRNRLRSYFQKTEQLEVKVRALMNHVADFDYIVTATELEAFILENNLIKSYQPRYNIQLRDDKSYPYLKLSVAEEFPRLTVVREVKDNMSRYFGPYADVIALRQTVRMLGKIFPLRTCKNMSRHQRPCLKYHLRLCSAPCADKVTAAEYNQVVEEALAFLEDGGQAFIQARQADMEQAVQQLDFEQAARLRDQIKVLQKWRERQHIDISSRHNLDIIGLTGAGRELLLLLFQIRQGRIVAKDTYWLKHSVDETPAQVLSFFLKQFYAGNIDFPQEIAVPLVPEDVELLTEWLRSLAGFRVKLLRPQRGKKRNLFDLVQKNAALLWEEKKQTDSQAQHSLQELAVSLQLDYLPMRIEGYDISHFSGEEVVGSMVVFTAGRMDKKAYRRFKIHQDRNDDYTAQREILTRRLLEIKKGNPAFLPVPDLIMIDGGRGQVNVAQQVLKQFGYAIPVCALAEKNEEIYLLGNAVPLRLPLRNEGLSLLRRLRDEAHRFAVQYSRRRKQVKLSNSVLDNIDGVGAKRKAALLKQFGSVEQIRRAGYAEVLQVPGINKEVAKKILAYFQQLDTDKL